MPTGLFRGSFWSDHDPQRRQSSVVIVEHSVIIPSPYVKFSATKTRHPDPDLYVENHLLPVEKSHPGILVVENTTYTPFRNWEASHAEMTRPACFVMAINRKHPLAGLCYVLSEAFYHMHGRRMGLKPVRLRYYGMTHWWLESPSGQIIDFTAGQYTRPFPYRRGRRGGFLTRNPSKRAKAVIDILKTNALQP